MAKIYSRELRDVSDELDKALRKHPKFNGAHEGWAVIREEVDELWDEIKKKQKDYDLLKQKKEAIQVAAMAVRIAVELCYDAN